MKTLNEVKKGDWVWVVTGYSRIEPYQSKVDSAGPKWITVGGTRYLRDCGTMENRSQHRIYASEEELLAVNERRLLLKDIQKRLERLDRMTMDQLRDVAFSLGVNQDG